MAPPYTQRRNIAQDTIARTPSISSSTPGANLSSTFIKTQLPALSLTTSPHYLSSKIRVVNSDAFTEAREIMKIYPNAIGKTAVLNLASDEVRAGGWIESLSTTQEEALCYSSTLYATLLESYYPWPNLGPGSVAGVFSPAIVVFKDDLDHDCADLPASEHRIVSVITVAAPRFPALTEDKEGLRNEHDMEDLQGKIRLIYRMAAHNGQEYLVLGAMGCGAYRCPPKLVAQEMKSILLEDEFKGWFCAVVFAVYSSRTNGHGNYEIFKECFEGVNL